MTNSAWNRIRSINLPASGSSVAFLLAVLLVVSPAAGQQPSSWIWSPVGDSTLEEPGQCFFRKKFTLIKPERAELQFATQGHVELFVNGREVTIDQTSVDTGHVDVSSHLQSGVNLIAMRVQSTPPDSGKLAVKFRVKEIGETRWRCLTSDDSWLTRNQLQPMWQFTSFDDVTWLRALANGTCDLNTSTAPVGELSVRETIKGLPATVADRTASTAQASRATSKKQVAAQHASVKKPAVPNIVAADKTNPSSSPTSVSKQQAIAKEDNSRAQNNAPKESKIATKPVAGAGSVAKKADSPQPDPIAESEYVLQPEFKLQQIMGSEESGSIIAMAFDEFGRLIMSRESGPLIVADFAKTADEGRVEILCDEVSSCQGILPLNGKVYVTGTGPDGLALYEIGKTASDSKMRVQRTVLKFHGEMGEHGPHGITLGPDGFLYVVVGNHSGIVGTADANSPLAHCYDADLVPRFEDPGGHAAGVKAPGGTIVRVSLDGKRVENFAGGLRNAYDLAFNAAGDLFIHESDMEANMGMSWYRPTSLYHVVAGADLGWRSGWSQMPDYYLDTIPAIAETGRGSPTGMVSYQHLQFPARYDDCLFLADWSEGRILAAKLNPNGSGYETKAEVFLSGKPLNVTDLDVGEDGGLYFCTGGRGTAGGVFRITWNGDIPSSLLDFKNNLDRVLRHPQPNSAWARQNLAVLRQSMGGQWTELLTQAALETNNTADMRIRAIDLLLLHSGIPSTELLQKLAVDKEEAVRAKTASICGLKQGNEQVLDDLIVDASERVQLAAASAFLRLDEKPSPSIIIPLLARNDCNLSLVARRLLEQQPDDQWCRDVIDSKDIAVFLNGSVATLNAHPTLANSYKILANCSQLMKGYLKDSEFVGMLRVVQLALVRGQVDPDKIPAFVEQFSDEFPTSNGQLNRELIRILAYLNVSTLEGRFIDYLENSKDDSPTKVLVAMHLASMASRLDDDTRLKLIAFLHQSQKIDGGGSYRQYVVRCIRETAGTLTEASAMKVIKNGNQWSDALIPVFFNLPEKATPELVAMLIQLDKELVVNPGDAARQARLGIIALLAQSQTEEAMEHLRGSWLQEEMRRGDIAIGLAQSPSGKNWNYLVASLPILDDVAAVEVMQKLLDVSLRPVEAKYFRQVIEIGFRMQGEGALATSKLLEHWSAETVSDKHDQWETTMEAWKTWFETKWPAETPVNTNIPPVETGHSMDRILEQLSSAGYQGSAERGLADYNSASCAKCHRLGTNGLATGPELTGIASRFSKRETLESILNPSKIIPDRYQSKLVLTSGGDQIIGLQVGDNGDSISLQQTDGQVIRVAKSEIEETKTVNQSAMPANLLDSLTLEQIADLFAFMYSDSTVNRVGSKSGFVEAK